MMNLHSNMYIYKYVGVMYNIYSLDTLSKLHVSPIQIMMFLHFYSVFYGTAKQNVAANSQCFGQCHGTEATAEFLCCTKGGSLP